MSSFNEEVQLLIRDARAAERARLLPVMEQMRDALQDCKFALGRGGANVVGGHNRAQWEAASDALAAYAAALPHVAGQHQTEGEPK